jgi:hypothetical protein
MASGVHYPASLLQSLCERGPGRAFLFVLACGLGVEAGTVCRGTGLVSPGEVFATIFALPFFMNPLVFIVAAPVLLLTYGLSTWLFVFLLLRDNLHWITIGSLLAVSFLVSCFDAYMFFR